MDTTFEVLYKSLEANVLRLQQKMIELKNENVQLKEKLTHQLEQNSQMQYQLNEWQEKYKLLKDAGVLSLVEKEDVNRMRHRIDSLVREIDECIALMTNE
ncbi:MAG TPA: hypothetical protein PKG63_03195 [Bacteroidales bacterium]|jgi:predicted nuclease with TOPRIM domain|nr:hypothetical protein [Bacteroidales bacterium]HNV95455.1 hypothetical protein [Bacteroidales bacterium]HOU98855.1 hypothetical protein [Bacteroidales bacterium]